jgi:hypothetical protein
MQKTQQQQQQQQKQQKTTNKHIPRHLVTKYFHSMNLMERAFDNPRFSLKTGVWMG